MPSFRHRLTRCFSEDWDDELDLERGYWTWRFDFLISVIGFVVGLGNFWRFPSICYENGGGAFIVAYVVSLVAIAFPLELLELALGQFSSLGSTGLWACCPLFKGIGYTMTAVTGLTVIYYNVLISYALFYMGTSFRTTQLPWLHSNNSWNTPNCREYNNTADGSLHGLSVNNTVPAQEFWEFEVLKKSVSIEKTGDIQPYLCGTLFSAWLVVFLCLIRGIKSTGKVVYVTATLPYICITVLIIQCATLPGAGDGIKYYFSLDVERLKHLKVWQEAAEQVFFSLGFAFGSLATLASYNRFSYKHLYRDTLVVGLVNACSSIFAGFAVFAVIGFMAHQHGQAIESLTVSGKAVVFVAYAEACAQSHYPQVFSAIFFLSMVLLGFDSQFIMVETCISAAADEFPGVVRRHKVLFTGLTALAGFLLGLPLITSAGDYWLTLMDSSIAKYGRSIGALLEVSVIIYIYGIPVAGKERFYNDVKSMTGVKPNLYWQISWRFITPIAILFIVCITIYQDVSNHWMSDSLPWVRAVAFLIVVCPLLCIPAYMIMEFIRHKQRTGVWGCFRSLVEPAPDWGPALPEDKEHRRHLDVVDSIMKDTGESKTEPRYSSQQTVSLSIFQVSEAEGGHGTLTRTSNIASTLAASVAEYSFSHPGTRSAAESAATPALDDTPCTPASQDSSAPTTRHQELVHQLAEVEQLHQQMNHLTSMLAQRLQLIHKLIPYHAQVMLDSDDETR